MANDLNLCVFTGRLGQDPEVRFTQSGTAIANLSIAVGGRKKSGDQWEDKTTWTRLVAIGKTAEIMGEHLSKGSLIRVTTEYQSRKWQGNDGQDNWAHEFFVKEFQFLESRNTQSNTNPRGQARSSNTAQQNASGGGFDDDQIPF